MDGHLQPRSDETLGDIARRLSTAECQQHGGKWLHLEIVEAKKAKASTTYERRDLLHRCIMSAGKGKFACWQVVVTHTYDSLHDVPTMLYFGAASFIS